MSELTKKAFFDCLCDYIDNGIVVYYKKRIFEIEKETIKKKLKEQLDEEFYPTVDKFTKYSQEFLDYSDSDLRYMGTNGFNFIFGIESSKESHNIDLTCRIREEFSILNLHWEDFFKFENLGIYSEEYVLNMISILRNTLQAIKSYVNRFNRSHEPNKILTKLQDRFIIDYSNYLKIHVKNIPKIEKNINTEFKEYNCGFSIKSCSVVKTYIINFNKEGITERKIKKDLCEATFDFLKSKNISYKENLFSFSNGHIKNQWFKLPKNENIAFLFNSTHRNDPIEKIYIEINPNSWEIVGVDKTVEFLPTI